MMKLNITDTILDKLGFSEYIDGCGDWGTRILTFSNGVNFRIVEQDEMDDIHSLFSDAQPKYVANHFYFAGWIARPKVEGGIYPLFFLHEMYEVIQDFYPSCLGEFYNKCKRLNMSPYIDTWLSNK